ncbi:MAG: transcriptional regulator [Clostridiales bacterium]|nr:MAG: transcriptional regulator [Clostridiales bacterium]
MKNKIRELRKQKGLTQADLAKLTGTTRQTIISIENGRYTASLSLAYKISKVFDLSIEDVFDFREEV